MAMRLTDHIWTVSEYIRYPDHVDDLKREIWAEVAPRGTSIGPRT
jgi:hypothetical protein